MKLGKLLTHDYPIEDINRAFDDLENGHFGVASKKYVRSKAEFLGLIQANESHFLLNASQLEKNLVEIAKLNEQLRSALRENVSELRKARFIEIERHLKSLIN